MSAAAEASAARRARNAGRNCRSRGRRGGLAHGPEATRGLHGGGPGCTSRTTAVRGGVAGARPGGRRRGQRPLIAMALALAARGDVVRTAGGPTAKSCAATWPGTRRCIVCRPGERAGSGLAPRRDSGGGAAAPQRSFGPRTWRRRQRSPPQRHLLPPQSQSGGDGERQWR